MVFDELFGSDDENDETVFSDEGKSYLTTREANGKVKPVLREGLDYSAIMACGRSPEEETDAYNALAFLCEDEVHMYFTTANGTEKPELRSKSLEELGVESIESLEDNYGWLKDERDSYMEKSLQDSQI